MQLGIRGEPEILDTGSEDGVRAVIPGFPVLSRQGCDVGAAIASQTITQTQSLGITL